MDVSVERLNAGAPDYISAARRDPDGKGLRIALARKVTVNGMTAGERVYVDLLPDTWTRAPAGPAEGSDRGAMRAAPARRSERSASSALSSNKAR